MVNPIIAEHQHAIVQICRRFRVARLHVFGSAAQGDFDEQSSDLDFLVDFGDVPDAERFDAFFGLQRALAGCPILRPRRRVGNGYDPRHAIAAPARVRPPTLLRKDGAHGAHISAR